MGPALGTDTYIRVYPSQPHGDAGEPSAAAGGEVPTRPCEADGQVCTGSGREGARLIVGYSLAPNYCGDDRQLRLVVRGGGMVDLLW